MGFFPDIDHLAPLGKGHAFTVVSDDADLCDQLSADGFTAVLWSPDLEILDGSRVLLALCHQLVSRAVRKQFSGARVLVLPIYSFDEDPENILYTVRMVFETDYGDACQRNREWLDMLQNKRDSNPPRKHGNIPL